MAFNDYWNSYPDGHPCLDATGQPAFENQCAIRLSVALARGGADLSGFDGQTCWHGHDGQHVLRAEELADWLSNASGDWAHTETYEGASPEMFSGRRGIIMCQNFWGDGNQGDHIDLWDGSEMRDGSADYITRSERVRFWEVRA